MYRVHPHYSPEALSPGILRKPGSETPPGSHTQRWHPHRKPRVPEEGKVPVHGLQWLLCHGARPLARGGGGGVCLCRADGHPPSSCGEMHLADSGNPSGSPEPGLLGAEGARTVLGSRMWPRQDPGPSCRQSSWKARTGPMRRRHDYSLTALIQRSGLRPGAAGRGLAPTAQGAHCPARSSPRRASRTGPERLAGTRDLEGLRDSRGLDPGFRVLL